MLKNFYGLIFQRISSNTNSAEILKSAVDWEDHRLTQESISDRETLEIKGRFKRFRQSLLELPQSPLPTPSPASPNINLV